MNCAEKNIVLQCHMHTDMAKRWITPAIETGCKLTSTNRIDRDKGLVK